MSFGVETILMRNPRVNKIESNHADANVEQYRYDYIIENNGSLEQLDSTIDVFVKTVIEKEYTLPESAYCIHYTDTGKNTIVFECNKMLG